MIEGTGHVGKPADAAHVLLAQEIERLKAENQRLHHRCAALAYLHYGHYLVQRTPESVQSDIEACESALTALRAELRDLPQSAEQQF